MSPKLTNPYNGLLNINKPAGMTSHDVVNRVRRILGQKRVGHAGTLDPAATGILLVCAGQATRLVEYLVPGIKTYQGTIRLGQATDTYDSEGEFTSETETDHLDRGMVEAAMVSFTGDIEQIPPAYSAIKRDGVPSYKLARKGKDVNLPARRIRIESFELLGWNQPELTFRIVCQSGTYVRSIAHDLGAALEVGGYLQSLCRTGSGSWRVEDALDLTALEQAAADGRLGSVIRPFSDVLTDMPGVTITEKEIAQLGYGQELPLEVEGRPEIICARAETGRLVAILVPTGTNRWRPKKVFPETG